MKTAIEQHIECLKLMLEYSEDFKLLAHRKEIITVVINGCISSAEKLKGSEKQQIQKAYNAGAKFGSEISSEDYYVQQFIDNTW